MGIRRDSSGSDKISKLFKISTDARLNSTLLRMSSFIREFQWIIQLINNSAKSQNPPFSRLPARPTLPKSKMINFWIRSIELPLGIHFTHAMMCRWWWWRRITRSHNLNNSFLAVVEPKERSQLIIWILIRLRAWKSVDNDVRTRKSLAVANPFSKTNAWWQSNWENWNAHKLAMNACCCSVCSCKKLIR